MSINLINNYIKNTPQQRNSAPFFDIQNELDNRAFIKPLPGKGKLLKGNILNAPALMLKDIKYDLKALKHAVKGNANDHELGKINDIGLKVGGLGIAGYLFTKRPTAMTKGMEFIGLGSFLASMAIWPKIAIQLPAYLIHGVNVQKEYEDSFGRKKPFYQDPQFIPWDLYSEEEIYKIGDRLGVPRNIPNRREFIQEKMKKLAVQNNTLWMLTAGFATPIMSALICNQAEPYLTKFFNNLQNKKADGILYNLDAYSDKHYKNNHIQNALTRLFELNKGKPLSKELQDAIFAVMSEGTDLVTQESLKRDLTRMLNSSEYVINEDTAKAISSNLTELFSERQFSEGFINSVIPSSEDISTILGDKFNTSVDKKDFRGIIRKIILDINSRLANYNATAAKKVDASYVRSLILNTPTNQHPILSALNKTKAAVFDSSVFDRLKHAAALFDNFNARVYSLDDYVGIKTGSAPETVSANYWNALKKDVLNLLGFTSNDIERAKSSQVILDRMLREKFDTIAADKNTYESVLDTLCRRVNELYHDINSSEIAATYSGNQVSAYEQLVDAVFNNHSKALLEAGFTDFANAISNPDSAGTLKNVQKTIVSDKLLGFESSLHRIINNLIVFRQLAVNPDEIPGLKIYPKEVKEELIELCKTVTLEGHSSDFATKFYLKRNPHPSDDYSPLKFEKGRLVSSYSGQGVDIAGDKYFYQDGMRIMFETPLDDVTSNILQKNMMRDRIVRYRTLILEKLGGEYYFPKPNHLIRAKCTTPSDIKFQLTGMATNEYVFKAVQETFNSKKWLKMYGGFGAGLLGVTVLAQFFLGRMKKPEVKK